MSAGHGTDNRYKRRKDPCRCEACVEAHREYEAKRRAAVDIDTLTHGRRATYDAGCRCADCKRARHEAHLREYTPKTEGRRSA